MGYKAASKEFCSTKWRTTWARFKQGVYPNSDAERLETQCFKSAWVAVALHEGLSFPLHYGHLTAAPNRARLSGPLDPGRPPLQDQVSSTQGYWKVWNCSPTSQQPEQWLHVLHLHCVGLPLCCVILYCIVCLQTTTIRETQHTAAGS